VQRRPAAGAIERTAQNLAIDSHHALHLLAELGHKPLECIAKLIRVESPEQSAEGVVFGHTVLQAEKAAKKGPSLLGEQSHIGWPLSPAKHTA
jgi:hypothetical protein